MNSVKGRRQFTLIEITLALGVVAVGFVAILGLFPIGANASRDAIGYTHAAESADNLLHLFAYRAKKEWSGFFQSYVPNDNDNRDSNSLPAPTSSSTGLPGSRGTIHEINASQGLYQVLSFSDNDTTDNVFNPSGATVDFNGVMAVWKEDIPILDPGGDLLTPTNRKIGVTLKVEVSWPADRPYDARNKELYSLEIFNPLYFEGTW